MGYDKQRKTDPLVGFQFELDTGAAVTGYFAEVGGIGSESDVVDQKVTAKGKPYIQKMPGRLKWGDVTLKRGITADMEIWTWRKMVEDGDMIGARKNCTVTMYDAAGGMSAQWTFDNAWPSKVTGPAIKADSNEFGVEEVVIVHEGMRRVKV
jgi:phage tail-like protein